MTNKPVLTIMAQYAQIREACEFVKKVDFKPSDIKFDAAFDE